MEMYSTAAPQFVNGKDIFGKETIRRTPADAFVVLRAPLGSNHRQNSAAIRRRDCDPTAKLETTIGNHAESELIDIELQASVMVAYENIGLENTQIRSLFARAGRGMIHVRPLQPLRSGAPGNFRFRAQVDLLSAWNAAAGTESVFHCLSASSELLTP